MNGDRMITARWLREIDQQQVIMPVLDEYLQAQIELFDLALFDLKLLKWLHTNFRKEIEDLCRGLCQYSLSKPKLRRLLESNPGGQNALLHEQITLLFDGRIDSTFLDYCQKIAANCLHFNIRPSYYHACIRRLERRIYGQIIESIPSGLPLGKIIAAVNKYINFEEQVTLLAYEQIDRINEKAKEKSMRYKAYHEPMTGLPNSRLAQKTLEAAIRRCTAAQSTFSVFKLNIYRLKMVNQTFDRKCGDYFLQSFAERVLAVTRAYDAMLCRINSDEFLIICQDVLTMEQQRKFAESLLHTSDKPYLINGKKIFGSFNIGIAIFPEHGKTSNQLQINADAALGEAKKKGRNHYEFYTSSLHQIFVQRMIVENELQTALINQQFLLFFQPQIRSSDRRVTGVEALVRWAHPDKGLLAPGSFISVAEESGMIRDIGQWVLKNACLQMRKWQKNGGPKIPISVNLSMRQFHDEALLDNIAEALAVSGLAPKYLDLEITESTMAKDIGRSKMMLNEIRRMGISVSLDDFGTGYSSLSYLKSLPINRLKIDRSFVTDIDSNIRDRAIVAAIVAMAEHLWIDVLAEGIETENQLSAVASCRCDTIQGYFYSKPIAGCDFERQFLKIKQ
ncbi:MAG: EAL domain-containing protein [Sporolactobacillus sp.]